LQAQAKLEENEPAINKYKYLGVEYFEEKKTIKQICENPKYEN